MLATTSRTHAFTYAVLLTVVMVCASVHLADIIGAYFGDVKSTNLALVTVTVVAVLAPPASILLWIYSHNLIKLQERFKGLAVVDPLTRVQNRRAFAEAFDREVARFQRTGQRMALVLIDLDQFKALNMDYGNAAGDEVLTDVASALSDAIRTGTDYVARWGGEEFAILLSNTGRQSAIRAAARFRQAIEALEVPYGEDVLTVTTSIGVIECTKTETLESAIARADRCLREAKRRGRNKVVAFPAALEDAELDEAAAS